MSSTETPPDRRSFADLSRAVLGRPLSIGDAWEFAMRKEFEPERSAGQSCWVGSVGAGQSCWVGSVGYERHRDVALFASHLHEAGVQRLVDVRELPISRRKGYAKTALGEALSEKGIEYVHMRDLGNPKQYRDLYKSGKVEEGRELYTAYLQEEQREALELLASILPEKKTALMCVEHDTSVCHRTVILETLVSELGLDIEVADIS